MSEAGNTNPIRKWRETLGLTLDQACDLFPKRGYERPSIAKLSRIERDQVVPADDVPAVAAVTGLPARELRPDLAELFGAVQ